MMILPAPLFAAQPTKVFCRGFFSKKPESFSPRLFFKKAGKFFAEAFFSKKPESFSPRPFFQKGWGKIHASRAASVTDFAGGRGFV
ncbi:hypothetical protein [Anaerotruncus colihominis]|uniref:Uncharacterized protein n=1 Tax=Anaerotruncus colihominis TaxID=169435 RepID=A0A845SZ99_9FIRM|nr:hypothetical protein [Anaerotruncus colihominis]MCR2026834.1 hypothetical protein [Anaerotruncus colihominis]NDO39592.1 hypothetical protein [Anaerotruncus colihominis]